MTLDHWDGESRHKCPCGKGEYLHRWRDYSSFSGHKSDEYLMLCPECSDKFVYDNWTYVGGHPGNFSNRGWVLRSILAEEQSCKARLVHNLESQFRAIWKGQFASCRSKKDVWRVLTCNGKYDPSYSTFLQHHKVPLDEVVRDISMTPFDHHMLNQVLDVCGVSNPDWDALGVKPEDQAQ